MARVKQQITSFDGLNCPTDFILINDFQARVTAGLVFISASLYLLTGFWGIPVLLVVDFALRVANKGSYSPFWRIAGLIVSGFKIGFRGTDRAPKRFAATIGLLFSIAILSLAGYSTVSAVVLASILALFALLESVFGFCAGCHVFSLLVKFGLIRKPI
ncbi:DUF4395 domain-containing protein [Olivibacter sitiensis]|uniref:DUF4395 domain-containing protein n=1 Tax=Olivibacter sitiensis TaxID=376470 RepID=UPI0004182B2A|nr:DUF4395 domain-containing protein [Olivibacter sitiensis]